MLDDGSRGSPHVGGHVPVKQGRSDWPSDQSCGCCRCYEDQCHRDHETDCDASARGPDHLPPPIPDPPWFPCRCSVTASPYVRRRTNVPAIMTLSVAMLERSADASTHPNGALDRILMRRTQTAQVCGPTLDRSWWLTRKGDVRNPRQIGDAVSPASRHCTAGGDACSCRSLLRRRPWRRGQSDGQTFDPQIARVASQTGACSPPASDQRGSRP